MSTIKVKQAGFKGLDQLRDPAFIGLEWLQDAFNLEMNDSTITTRRGFLPAFRRAVVGTKAIDFLHHFVPNPGRLPATVIVGSGGEMHSVPILPADSHRNELADRFDGTSQTIPDALTTDFLDGTNRPINPTQLNTLRSAVKTLSESSQYQKPDSTTVYATESAVLTDAIGAANYTNTGTRNHVEPIDVVEIVYAIRQLSYKTTALTTQTSFHQYKKDYAPGSAPSFDTLWTDTLALTPAHALASADLQSYIRQNTLGDREGFISRLGVLFSFTPPTDSRFLPSSIYFELAASQSRYDEDSVLTTKNIVVRVLVPPYVSGMQTDGLTYNHAGAATGSATFSSLAGASTQTGTIAATNLVSGNNLILLAIDGDETKNPVNPTGNDKTSGYRVTFSSAKVRVNYVFQADGKRTPNYGLSIRPR